MHQPELRQSLNDKPDPPVRWASGEEPACSGHVNPESEAMAGSPAMIEAVNRSALQHNPLLGTMFADVRVSVVVPALNEAPNLAHVLPRIPIWVHEVLLVDGHSTDDTIAVARQILPNIIIIKQEGYGKGAALRCGFQAATGEIIVHLDADGSTDPIEIPAFVGALLSGADYVKGSRFLQGADTVDMTLLRKIGNNAFVALTNILFGTRFTDITYGYNAVWRCHRNALALEIDNWANEIIGNIRAARNGLRVVEVACFEHERIAGQAKLQTFSAGWQILKAIVRERVVPLPIPMATRVSSVEQPVQELEREVGGA